MSLPATPQTSPSSVPSTNRSLLSRLTSPLRSRTRNLADFHIRPLEPHRQYSPGDVVKGLVVLTVVKPIRVTHLTVALHGFVRVFKSPSVRSSGRDHEPHLSSASNGGKSQSSGNGQASLFQDEVTLCGEGRLEIGVYEFEFELEFPNKGLPTSIDFERGSISYMIRATITRPTSIAATSSCHRNLSLIETVDIGVLAPPKPRVISLEPYPKKAKISTKSTSSKTKLKPGKENTEVSNDMTQTTNSPVPEESASQRPSSDHTGLPRSPISSDVHSEASGESVVSSSSTGFSFKIAPSPPSVKSAADGQGGIVNSLINSKTIRATIELLKAGCLPGDSVPLRVSIQHTKFIRSVRGIIITLYRQSRIDSAPPLSLFMDVKGKAAEKLKHEEYYPKSKTGLGGLSLTSAGSSSVFRKDLSQTIAPIIIDPSTLSTVVTASIRVPDNVFPTITGVPGEMISFRYHIEVVIDLGGKLSGQSKHIPRLGMVNVPSNFMDSNYQVNIPDGGANAGMLATWGTSIINTDHIRREKSVVACLFEIIVGTTDSARLRGRGNTLSGVQNNPQTTVVPQSPAHSGNFAYEHEVLQDHGEEETPTDPNHVDAGHHTEASQPDQEDYSYEEFEINHDPPQQSIYTAPIYVPMPEIPSEEGLTEKERIHLAEQRLLPSQPPQDDEPSFSHAIIPSAPEDLDGDLYGVEDEPTCGRSAVVDLGSEVRNLETAPDSIDAPSAPAQEDLRPQNTVDRQEDKQELERQRLMAEASSPSDFPHDTENGGEGRGGTQHEPSAPTLTEEGEYGGHYMDGYGHQEGLPRYER